MEKNQNDAECMNPIYRLRRGCIAIKLSNKLSQNFECYRDQMKLPDLTLLNDICTRWNSTKYMIDRFLLLEDAYLMTINGCPDENIRNLCSLTNNQILYIKKVNGLLSVFEYTTLWLSSQR